MTKNLSVISFLIAGSVLAVPASAQTTFGTNLIVNGGAESGPGGSYSTPAASVPGWTRTGGADVYGYVTGNALAATDIVPVNAGNNYFSGGGQQANSSFSQTINVAAAASTIDGGGVTFDLSGYMGAYSEANDYASLSLTFFGANGAVISPGQNIQGVQSSGRANGASGLYLGRAIGPVPTGTRSLQITLTMNYVDGSVNEADADNLVLILNAPTAATSLLGTNLILNPGADATPGLGAPNTPGTPTSQDLPNWVRDAFFTADSYLDPDGDLTPQTPGLPPNPGPNYFYGGESVVDPSNPVSKGHQDIDVSSASSLIDSGSVNFTLSGWLGGISGQGDNAVVTATFYNWAHTSLGSGTIGPEPAAGQEGTTQLFFHTQSGALPTGTRYVRVEITMTRTDGSNDDGLADNLSLILNTAPGSAPVINAAVFASAYGEYHAASPGSFIEIYGSNLAAKTGDWSLSFVSGTAPTTLDNVSVTVAGVPAYVAYVSPDQVNALIPDGTPTSGSAPVVVTFEGSASNSFSLSMNALEPGILAPSNFKVNGRQYAAAFHANNTFVGNGHIVGIQTSPAKPGETIVFYGLGFGPAQDSSGNALPLAGQIITVANSLTNDFQFLFGTNQEPGNIAYGGMASNYTGLYQFNITVPLDAPSGDLPLLVTLNGANVPQTLYITVQ